MLDPKNPVVGMKRTIPCERNEVRAQKWWFWLNLREKRDEGGVLLDLERGKSMEGRTKKLGMRGPNFGNLRLILHPCFPIPSYYHQPQHGLVQGLPAVLINLTRGSPEPISFLPYKRTKDLGIKVILLWGKFSGIKGCIDSNFLVELMPN